MTNPLDNKSRASRLLRESIWPKVYSRPWNSSPTASRRPRNERSNRSQRFTSGKLSCGLLILTLIILAGCQAKGGPYKVLVGASVTVEEGTRPIQDAVIIIDGKNVRDVGDRNSVPVPNNADRTDLTGRYVIPAPGKRIHNGEPANLLILDHAPAGIVPANPKDVGARIIDGEWAPAN
ncbi:MAG TPA: hypothetical protein VEF06_12550 [Bryobacteraceae bacterium]|nr:hypothetical protein [Bryobacteraceae bacterium]